MKKWLIKNIQENFLIDFIDRYNLTKLVSKILLSRFEDEIQAISFLFGSEDLQNPYDIKDMLKAVRIIRVAISQNKKITIFGDYDADGVTSTAVLYNYLFENYKNIDYYISDRFSEGYGINRNAVDKLYKSGTELIITVDNGINAVDAVDYAKQKGISVIITDHHISSDVLPDADAIVNPNRYDCSSKYKYYSGVGVVFKLICALEQNDYKSVLNKFSDLISIGTISDLVPMIGENRFIVKHGLLHLCNPSNTGIKEMLNFLNLNENSTISSTDIAFSISPRINSAGRLDHAYKALDIFIDSEKDVKQAILNLDELNKSRKNQEIEQLEMLNKIILKDSSCINLDVIVIFCENLNQGIIGILASRICEKYSKPTIIVTNGGDDECKASCRSISGFDMFCAIKYCENLLLYYGGHKMACGFSLKKENLELFIDKVNEYFKNVQSKISPPFIDIDAYLTLEDLSLESVESLNYLEPFGTFNKFPNFVLKDVKICAIYEMGEGLHSKLKVEFKKQNFYINWFKKKKNSINYCVGDIVDIAVSLGLNYYNGNKSVSITLVDIKISNLSDEIFCDFHILQKIKKNLEFCEEEVSMYTPDRDSISLVYKVVKFFPEVCSNLQKMFFKLGNGRVSYSKMIMSLWVLDELGLIYSIKKDEVTFYKYLNTDKKVDIARSTIINNLKTKRKIR